MEVNFYNAEDYLFRKELDFIPQLNSFVKIFDEKKKDYVKYVISDIDYIVKGSYMGVNINLVKNRQ